MSKHKYTNNLSKETSPYLLQHAYNPVNWFPWGEEALEKAKRENKLIIVSIGYSACHWCHVMEHESFEDEEVADVMNENFVCIKVDREERPDVDNYYMTAVHLMRQQGGWPLNAIALPNGRPIWGGTYFPKESWTKNILSVANYYRQNPEKTIEYAENLKQGIDQVSLATEIDKVIPANRKLLEDAIEGWKPKFDMKLGGRKGQAKFPMPVTLDFLLYYGHINEDDNVKDFVKTTLTRMAHGGIYDQVGGGFARYSVDSKWKVPHFEKMLYDNGQLLSVYSKAYQLFKDDEYKRVVSETVEFLKRELMDSSGAFYSALDADSEGEEGKFYIWNKEELQNIITKDFDLFSEYFNINSKGFWEHGNHILLKDKSDYEFADKHSLSISEVDKLVLGWKEKILKEREKRVRPGLDDKTLTSWNALAIQGLVDAYKAFGDIEFLKLAENNAEFILGNQLGEGGKLHHSWKKGISKVYGFMEDYALVIQAFISLFEVTGNEKWLTNVRTLVSYSFEHFYDTDKGLFYFSKKESSDVIINYFQNEDNVIPAANSVMANNLHKLYLLEGKPEYLSKSKRMLQHVTMQFKNYPMAYANWGTLMLKITEPYFEVAVAGKEAKTMTLEMQANYTPNILWAFSDMGSSVPLLKDRLVKGETLIYVCKEGACQMPVRTINEASEYIK